MGDDWIQRHRKIVQQHANQYKRNAWAKVIFLLIEMTTLCLAVAAIMDATSVFCYILELLL